MTTPLIKAARAKEAMGLARGAMQLGRKIAPKFLRGASAPLRQGYSSALKGWARPLQQISNARVRGKANPSKFWNFVKNQADDTMNSAIFHKARATQIGQMPDTGWMFRHTPKAPGGFWAQKNLECLPARLTRGAIAAAPGAAYYWTGLQKGVPTDPFVGAMIGAEKGTRAAWDTYGKDWVNNKLKEYQQPPGATEVAQN